MLDVDGTGWGKQVESERPQTGIRVTGKYAWTWTNKDEPSWNKRSLRNQRKDWSKRKSYGEKENIVISKDRKLKSGLRPW